MTGAWLDRAAVAAVMLAAALYLARLAWRRARDAFGSERPGACGPECGCGGRTTRP